MSEKLCNSGEVDSMSSVLQLSQDLLDTVKDPAKLSLLVDLVKKAHTRETEFQIHQSEQEKKLQDMESKLKETEKKLEEAELKLQESKSEVDVVKTELGQKIYEALEEELKCSICSEVFIQATVIDCNHAFCAHCIGVWTMNGNRECPLCRNENFRPLSSHNGIESFIQKVYELLPQDVRDHRSELARERAALPVITQQSLDIRSSIANIEERIAENEIALRAAVLLKIYNRWLDEGHLDQESSRRGGGAIGGSQTTRGRSRSARTRNEDDD